MDTLRILAYRAETVMAAAVALRLDNSDTALSLLKALFSSDASLDSDYQAVTLTVRLMRHATRGFDRALAIVLAELNQTRTVYPGTQLRLVSERYWQRSYLDQPTASPASQRPQNMRFQWKDVTKSVALASSGSTAAAERQESREAPAEVQSTTNNQSVTGFPSKLTTDGFRLKERVWLSDRVESLSVVKFSHEEHRGLLAGSMSERTDAVFCNSKPRQERNDGCTIADPALPNTRHTRRLRPHSSGTPTGEVASSFSQKTHQPSSEMLPTACCQSLRKDVLKRSENSDTPDVTDASGSQASWKDRKEKILLDFEKAHPDIRECISRIDVMRMGPLMIRLGLGMIGSAARRELADHRGPVQLANSDLSAVLIFEEAQYRGVRAAERVLERLGFRHLEHAVWQPGLF